MLLPFIMRAAIRNGGMTDIRIVDEVRVVRGYKTLKEKQCSVI